MPNYQDHKYIFKICQVEYDNFLNNIEKYLFVPNKF